MKRSAAALGLLLLPAAFFMSGCGLYPQVSAILPQHIKSIGIETFKNKTVESGGQEPGRDLTLIGMEDKLTLAVTREFINDRRLVVTDPNKADSVLIGSITRYVKEPSSYDENHVAIEYKLWVLVDLTYVDRVKNPPNGEVMFIEKNFEAKTTYTVSGTGIGVAGTEEEAREELWKIMAENIRKRVIEGFGSVTGASQRKISGGTNPNDTQNDQNSR